MDIQINGAAIVVGEGEMQEALDLLCVCGHKLSQHAYVVSYYFPDQTHHTLYSSQCVICMSNVETNIFDCPKFRISK